MRTLPAYITAGVGILLGTIAFDKMESGEKFPIALGVIAGVLIVVGIVLAIIHHKKTKAEENKPDKNLELLDKLYGDFDEGVKKDLGVPSDAPELEIFIHTYPLIIFWCRKNRQRRKIYVYKTSLSISC